MVSLEKGDSEKQRKMTTKQENNVREKTQKQTREELEDGSIQGTSREKCPPLLNTSDTVWALQSPSWKVNTYFEKILMQLNFWTRQR